MIQPLLDLQPTADPMRFRLEVTPRICVGEGHVFMFGGVGLASAVEAAKRVTGRELIWATAQYLSYARPGSMLEVDVRLPTCPPCPRPQTAPRGTSGTTRRAN